MEDIKHGRDAPARSRVSVAPTLSSDSAAVTADIDLTGVDPVHWAETSKRVAILHAWCANGRHPRHEAVAAAERMGTSVTHFYRLVATWKKHRDVCRVSGYPARRGDERGAKTVAADAHAILQRVIVDLGADARFTDVLAKVRSECAAAGVQAPSSGLVHRILMRARQSASFRKAETRDDIAVALVACLLPVTVKGRTLNAPGLVLAVERPGGVIRAHRLLLDEDRTGAARAVLSDISREADARVILAASLRDAVEGGGPPNDFLDARIQNICIEIATRATLLSTTLGSYIDSIPIRHRRFGSRAPGPWKPLLPADAVAAIDLAVAAHNAARCG